MILITLLVFVSCCTLVSGDDVPAAIQQKKRPGSKTCQDVAETLDTMISQMTSTNLYIEEIRKTLRSMSTRLENLEQGQKDLETIVREEVSDLTEKVSEALAETNGKLIPAAKVEQSSTYADYTGPEKAVDGDFGTQTHTTCDLDRQWFRYYFEGQRAVGQIKVVNGKLNANKHRLNGARVYVMASSLHRRPCRVGTVTVREGDSVEAQTYYLDCTGNTGIGVEFLLDTHTCLEFRQIEVFAP